MFHLKFPRFRGFLTWEELGCLSRALGYPVDLFKANIKDEIVSEEHGMNLKEAYKMVDHRLLERALHRTCNLHSGEWNMNALRKALYLASHNALTFEEIYNIRLAYQAFEAFDMKGMLMDERILLRSIKMCGRSIAPLKLMNRLKHMAVQFEDKTRIQLAEFLDLALWCGQYKEYTPEDLTTDNNRQNDLFKLVDFEELLSHHDHRLAKKLDKEYLEEEWEFGKENLGSKKMFKEPPVICGNERMEMARRQRKLYRHLKKEVVNSQKNVYRAKAGFVRERPLTAPDLSMYKAKKSDVDKAPITAQTAYELIQRRASSAKSLRSESTTEDMSDRPCYIPEPEVEVPRVISDQDLEETQKKYDDLIFDMATLEKRYELTKEQELNYYIPGYSDREIEESEDDFMPYDDFDSSRPFSSRSKSAPSRETIQNLAYPEPKSHNSHARSCDARFRGWHKVKTKRGDHFILTTPAFQHSYKGICTSTLVRKADAEVKKVRGKFAHRYTKKSDVKSSQEVAYRPFTAPAAMQRAKSEADLNEPSSLTDSCKTMDTGYGSSEEKVFGRSSPGVKGNSSQISEADSAYGSKSPLSTLRSRSPTSPHSSKSPVTASDVKSYSECDQDSNDTTVQTRTDARSPLKHKESANNVHESATDSWADPRDITQKTKAVHQSKAEIIRKKSGKQKELLSVDNAPVPQMQHSKPKVVSVGGIGKISLLEDISESQYWEDMGNQDIKSDSEEEDECFIEDAEDVEVGVKNEYEPRSRSEASLDKTALEERKEQLKMLSRHLSGEEIFKKSSNAKTKQKETGSEIERLMQKERDALQKKRNSSQGSLFLNLGAVTPRKEGITSSRSSGESSRKVSDSSPQEPSSMHNFIWRRELSAKNRIETKVTANQKQNIQNTESETQTQHDIKPKSGKPVQGNGERVKSPDKSKNPIGNIVVNKEHQSKRQKPKFRRLVQRMNGNISSYMATRLLSGKA